MLIHPLPFLKPSPSSALFGATARQQPVGIAFQQGTLYLPQNKTQSETIQFKQPYGITKALGYAYAVLKTVAPNTQGLPLLLLWQRTLESTTDLKKLATTQLLGWGANAIAWRIPGNQVLKLCQKPPFTRPHHPDFDLPVLKQGQIGTWHYYIQPYASPEVSKAQVKAVIDKIQNAGYALFDFSEDKPQQVGIYKGKAYLLDPECAVLQ